MTKTNTNQAFINFIGLQDNQLETVVEEARKKFSDMEISEHKHGKRFNPEVWKN